MPKIKGTIGTGITKRGVVGFDWNTPGDVDAQIAAAIRAFEQTSFMKLSERIASQAKTILAASGLPGEIQGVYALGGNGDWTRILEPLPGGKIDPEWMSLPEVVAALGYAVDSPEGYSASLLFLIAEAERLLRAGDIDQAMARAFTAGQQIAAAGIKEVWEKDALRGEKVVEGAQVGHEQVHGTEEEKLKRHAAYGRAFEAALKQGLSRMTAYDTVADKFRVSPVTVRRAVANARFRKAD